MKKLRVLWIEDTDSWYNAKMPYLKNLAAGVGFDLYFERYRGNEDLNFLKQGEPFDIALVDHKLKDKPNGEVVTGEILIELFWDWGIAHSLIYYSENPSDMKILSAKKEVVCVARAYIEDACMQSLDDWAADNGYNWDEE